MEPQLIEEVDFDDLYAEIFPSSAYVDKSDPAQAAYESSLVEKNEQNELGNATIMQSTLIEGEHEEQSCVPFSCVYLTFIIDAIERYLY